MGTRREQLRQARAVRRARAVAIASLIPGLGHLLAGRRRAGLLLLTATLLLVGALAYLASALTMSEAERLAVRSDVLLGVTAALLAIGFAWCGSILSAYRCARPMRMTRTQWLGSQAVVWSVCLAVMTPLTWSAQHVYAARDVLEVFRDDAIVAAPIPPLPTLAPVPAPTPTAPKPSPTPTPVPFADKERVNLLLLGGDGGPNRRGIRTDVIVIASIDTRTGRTALISIPRNLQHIPMRPGTRLAAAYPNGFADFWFGLYTAVQDNPDLMPGIRRENAPAAAVADATAYLTGLPIDYYAMVNMAGFDQLIDALGGVDIDVRSGNGAPIPIGGSYNADGSVTRPHDEIELGRQHLSGHKSLWYARSRFGTTDDERQARQRCLLTAMSRQLKPASVLETFRSFTSAAKQIMVTNIPAGVLPDFMDLARKHAQSARIDRVTILDIIGSSVYPNVDAIRARAAQAVEGKAPASAYRDHGVKREMC
ncbi:MAG: LCP family protein [Sporichthyaceae bacterium]